MRLGHCHQRDFFGAPPGAPCRLGNPFAYSSDVFGNRHKNTKPQGTRRSTEDSRLPLWDSVSSVVHSNYMIAVGGAGSSGRPAFASGTRIMTATSAASAIKLVTGWSPMAR